MASHVTVCICTFRREEMLRRLLEELPAQRTEGRFTFSLVVADNDAERSAEGVVTDAARRSAVEIRYCSEPRQNIALARNKAVENARGEFIVFIDDDELPGEGWLCNLFTACSRAGVDGVLGPVVPRFDEEPPRWVSRGGFHERPTHETGYRITLSDARTGNIIFRRGMLDGDAPPFRERFCSGGEDVDFIARMLAKGQTFLWCNEAVVYERVPPVRCTRRYLLTRALLRGSITLRQDAGRCGKVLKSMVAIPSYSLILPFAAMTGDHVVMKYLIRLCDHLGRVLSLLKLNPVKER